MTFPLVMITWLDATDIETGWTALQDIKDKKLASVESIGWLVEENAEKMTLIACLDETDQNGGRGVVIPKPWIVKRKKLEVCQEN
tara:strand:+ start:417 stop:671 length:255 start_codon:yes stop_codon:yes gene_type:complete